MIRQPKIATGTFSADGFFFIESQHRVCDISWALVLDFKKQTAFPKRSLISRSSVLCERVCNWPKLQAHVCPNSLRVVVLFQLTVYHYSDSTSGPRMSVRKSYADFPSNSLHYVPNSAAVICDHLSSRVIVIHPKLLAITSRDILKFVGFRSCHQDCILRKINLYWSWLLFSVEYSFPFVHWIID